MTNRKEYLRKWQAARYHKLKNDPEFRAKKRAQNNAWNADNRKRARELSNRSYAKVVLTPSGRAGQLLKSAKSRAKENGVAFDLTKAFVTHKLMAGYCEATGLQFSYEKPDGNRSHPRAPSLDKIDKDGGYTMNNVRVVVWQFNVARNEYSDDMMNELVVALAKRIQSTGHVLH